MNEPILSIALVLYVFGVFILFPGGVLALGWVLWVNRTQPRTVSGVLSLIGFTFTTLSCLLASSSAVYAYAHWMVARDYLPIRFVRSGYFLSLGGLGFGITGLWRPSPLRWYAPACALGTLFFWFALASDV